MWGQPSRGAALRPRDGKVAAARTAAQARGHCLPPPRPALGRPGARARRPHSAGPSAARLSPDVCDPEAGTRSPPPGAGDGFGRDVRDRQARTSGSEWVRVSRRRTPKAALERIPGASSPSCPLRRLLRRRRPWPSGAPLLAGARDDRLRRRPGSPNRQHLPGPFDASSDVPSLASSSRRVGFRPRLSFQRAEARARRPVAPLVGASVAPERLRIPFPV